MGPSDATPRLVEAHVGWRPIPGEFTLLAGDISDVTYIGHDEVNAQHVARWPDGGRNTFAGP